MKLEDLFESRSAPLYHGTSMFLASEIINHDMIAAKTSHFNHPALRAKAAKSTKGTEFVDGVSLTRSAMIAHRFGPIVFVLDQNKLRTKYRIEPVDYWHREDGENRRQYNFAEYEEFVVGPISPLHPYLKAILIDQNADHRKDGEHHPLFDIVLNHPLSRIVRRSHWDSIGMVYSP